MLSLGGGEQLDSGELGRIHGLDDFHKVVSMDDKVSEVFLLWCVARGVGEEIIVVLAITFLIAKPQGALVITLLEELLVGGSTRITCEHARGAAMNLVFPRMIVGVGVGFDLVTVTAIFFNQIGSLTFGASHQAGVVGCHRLEDKIASSPILENRVEADSPSPSIQRAEHELDFDLVEYAGRAEIMAHTNYVVSWDAECNDSPDIPYTARRVPVLILPDTGGLSRPWDGLIRP